jgi:hypothetical protein
MLNTNLTKKERHKYYDVTKKNLKLIHNDNAHGKLGSYIHFYLFDSKSGHCHEIKGD